VPEREEKTDTILMWACKPPIPIKICFRRAHQSAASRHFAGLPSPATFFPSRFRSAARIPGDWTMEFYYEEGRRKALHRNSSQLTRLDLQLPQRWRHHKFLPSITVTGTASSSGSRELTPTRDTVSVAVCGHR
jgi:hypothetical protein